jgi:NADPH2:quinone reductase
MTYAIRVHAPGGPGVLRWEPVEVGLPGAGEIRIRHTFVGLNFTDISYRSGLYPVAPFDLNVLGRKGSLVLTRPVLPTFIATKAQLNEVAGEL